MNKYVKILLTILLIIFIIFELVSYLQRPPSNRSCIKEKDMRLVEVDMSKYEIVKKFGSIYYCVK